MSETAIQRTIYPARAMAYPAQVRDNLLAMVRDGASVRDAAAALGVNRFTAYAWCRAAGIKLDTSRRGFASMDADAHRLIASLGGKTAHRMGVAHEYTPDEAREAGRKGGEALARNRAHMAAIGSRGGTNKARNARRAALAKSEAL